MKWIHHAVTILDNQEELPVLLVQQRFGAWMIFMSDQKAELGSLADSIPHLLKITRSYWSGLFHCYRVTNLPKTNNDKEASFWFFSASPKAYYWSKESSCFTFNSWGISFDGSSSYSNQNFHRN